MMHTLLSRFLLFLLPLVGYVLAVSWSNQTIECAPFETESNLVLVPRDTEFDMVVLGTSQARTFSREGVIETANKAFGSNWLNLSQGSGGGGLPCLYSLKYFFQRGNRADTVIYFVSPWVFFTEQSNTTHPMTRREPFRLDFLYTLATDTNATGQELRQYLYRVFSFDWRSKCTWQHSGEPMHLKQLQAVNTAAQLDAHDFMQRAVDAQSFHHFGHIISALMRVCEQYGAELIFADIPMLLDDVPGKATVDHAIQDTRCLHIKVPESLLKTEHFYDHMHLNREGVEVFLQHHLLQKLN